jgi:hypothetical protein
VQVKTIVDLLCGAQIIPKGTVLTVEVCRVGRDEFYRVLDEPYKGHEYWKHRFEIIEQTYSEKEWNDMENHYMSLLDKEIAAKNRAIEMVASLGKQIVKKNAEIEKLEFYVSALSIGLSASSEAIQVLRGKEKV